MSRFNARQRGFSLVELMIATTLSVIVGASIITVLLQTKRTNQQNDEVARMQENARIAMQILREDLLHATFLADVVNPIDTLDTTTNAPTTPNPDCAPNATAYNAGTIAAVLNYSYNQSAADVTAAYACIESTDVKATGNNVLLVKRTAAATATPTADDKVVYIHSSGTQAELYHNASGATIPSFTGNDWEYRVHVYYVDDDYVLSREYLKYGSTPAMTKEQLIDGIEYFHVEFGIDIEDDDNAVPDYYTATPTTAELADAVTARIYVLARSPERTWDLDYTNTKTYNMGTATQGPFNDRVYRRVYTTTVVIKNAHNRALMSDE